MIGFALSVATLRLAGMAIVRAVTIRSLSIALIATGKAHHDRLREKAGRLQANPQLHSTESRTPSPVCAREGETGAEMSDTAINFFNVLTITQDYVPKSRHETALRTLRQFSDTIEAQKAHIQQLETRLQQAILNNATEADDVA